MNPHTKNLSKFFQLILEVADLGTGQASLVSRMRTRTELFKL